MAGSRKLLRACAISLADDILREIRAARDWDTLRTVTRDFTDELGFRHFALITHEDLRRPRPGAVHLLDYPFGAVRRIIGECKYRRDPVTRAAHHAEAAYLWSQSSSLITIGPYDQVAFELGRREGLDEGITVPCRRLGLPLGSCTFAGLKTRRNAEPMLGPAQMFAVFAFERARRLAGTILVPAEPPRLAPRHRDCVVLAGQGLPDKLIAHRLGLTQRTVESYLRDARAQFGVRDRCALVTGALLDGEIDLAELRRRQGP